MAGFQRRAKPLKAEPSLGDLDDLIIVNPQDGDLLVYSSADSAWLNTKDLTGNYDIAGDLQVTTLGVDGLAEVGTLQVSSDALVGGDLTVTGTLVAADFSVEDLTVTGDSTFAGDVSIAGTLSFAGFSISGSGTIGGDLSVTGDISADDLVLLGDLTVAGTSSLHDVLVAGSVFATGNGSFAGNVSGAAITGNTVAAASTLYAGTSLGIAGATYTNTGIVFEDDETSWEIYNGTVLNLSLDALSIVEVTGVPTSSAYADGSLALSSYGDLYIRRASRWNKVVTDLSDLEFLLTDYYDRQELTITEELQASTVTTDTIVTGRVEAGYDFHIYGAGQERFELAYDGSMTVVSGDWNTDATSWSLDMNAIHSLGYLASSVTSPGNPEFIVYGSNSGNPALPAGDVMNGNLSFKSQDGLVWAQLTQLDGGSPSINLRYINRAYGGELKFQTTGTAAGAAQTALRLGAGAAAPTLAFYNTAPIAQQTGVAVTIAAVHAALVALGLITP